MEFAIALGIGGWLALIVGAIVFGGVAQFVGETRTGFEWVAAGIAAGSCTRPEQQCRMA